MALTLNCFTSWLNTKKKVTKAFFVWHFVTVQFPIAVKQNLGVLTYIGVKIFFGQKIESCWCWKFSQFKCLFFYLECLQFSSQWQNTWEEKKYFLQGCRTTFITEDVFDKAMPSRNSQVSSQVEVFVWIPNHLDTLTLNINSFQLRNSWFESSGTKKNFCCSKCYSFIT